MRAKKPFRIVKDDHGGIEIRSSNLRIFMMAHSGFGPSIHDDELAEMTVKLLNEHWVNEATPDHA